MAHSSHRRKRIARQGSRTARQRTRADLQWTRMARAAAPRRAARVREDPCSARCSHSRCWLVPADERGPLDESRGALASVLGSPARAACGACDLPVRCAAVPAIAPYYIRQQATVQRALADFFAGRLLEAVFTGGLPT